MGKMGSKRGPASPPLFLMRRVSVSVLRKPVSFDREWRIITVKDKATVLFGRLQSAEVIEDTINAAGEVSPKNFWTMSEEEYKWILKIIELDNPDIGVLPPIELTWN
ncbi:hypothetical protein NBG4_250009 [Candidatus Sulfobium mesophilum]|uniref:Uncharacterized protein n=1 Tax=Candidatus Sulfobium mesophilum TaxID=2016548 RepID=A0A2U3QGC6_9BACT|nr:hypothetical protein NBG4_250009 [Candidatus Sulfobium mesophilum]